MANSKEGTALNSEHVITECMAAYGFSLVRYWWLHGNNT
jgi:hypothetical protein